MRNIVTLLRSSSHSGLATTAAQLKKMCPCCGCVRGCSARCAGRGPSTHSSSPRSTQQRARRPVRAPPRPTAVHGAAPGSQSLISWFSLCLTLTAGLAVHCAGPEPCFTDRGPGSSSTHVLPPPHLRHHHRGSRQVEHTWKVEV